MVRVLYNHVTAYAVAGISFAKTRGTSPEEYGRFVGKLFTPFWDPAAGFQAFASQLMFLLAGNHPSSEMQITEQNGSMVRFKMKNVDLSFRSGPMFGVSFNDYLDLSYGVISEIADFMNVEFSHEMVDTIWYEVTLSAK